MSIEDGINELKENTFFNLMDLAGRVYIVVHYTEDVIIGKRGFTNEEKTSGLVLVFNQKTNFQWKDDVITAKLGFGNTIEKCIIPVRNIVCIFSPDINARFMIDYVQKEQESIMVKSSKSDIQKEKQKPHNESQSKVITVDFTKKNKK